MVLPLESFSEHSSPTANVYNGQSATFKTVYCKNNSTACTATTACADCEGCQKNLIICGFHCTVLNY